MNNEVKLSVIVPVYNVAPYLRDCLESLVSQGFSEGEYEVIVVDDGSTDNSLEIIQEYADKHSCIKCIHQENAGVSAARNTALDHATGEYVTFVDGDDFVITGALRKMCDEARRSNADTLVYDFVKVDENAHFKNVQDDGIIRFTNNQTGIAKSTAIVWNSFYKRNILLQNGLRFPEGMKYAEDTFFSAVVSMFVDPDKQVFCNCVAYCYRQRQLSAMHSKGEQHHVKHMKDMMNSIDAWSAFLEKYPELADYKKENIRRRKYLLSAAACLDALRCTEIDPYAIKEALEMREVYPYPRMKHFLKDPRNPANIIKYFLNSPVIFFFFSKTGLLRGK